MGNAFLYISEILIIQNVFKSTTYLKFKTVTDRTSVENSLLKIIELFDVL